MCVYANECCVCTCKSILKLFILMGSSFFFNFFFAHIDYICRNRQGINTDLVKSIIMCASVRAENEIKREITLQFIALSRIDHNTAHRNLKMRPHSFILEYNRIMMALMSCEKKMRPEKTPTNCSILFLPLLARYFFCCCFF